MASTSNVSIDCRVCHHGAAASSAPHSLLWFSDTAKKDSNPSVLAYASNGILNLASPLALQPCRESVMHVEETLRGTAGSLSLGKSEGNERRLITALSHVGNRGSSSILASGFSDGSINLWEQQGDGWKEFVVASSADNWPSVTDLEGALICKDLVVFVTCSSAGVHLHEYSLESSSVVGSVRLVSNQTANSALLLLYQEELMVVTGSAQVRHNKIHVATIAIDHEKKRLKDFTNKGYLSGHQDWITGLDWQGSTRSDEPSMLASGSKDARIRLWAFSFVTRTAGQVGNSDAPTVGIDTLDSEDIEDEEDLSDIDEPEEEGEARLQLLHEENVTNITLEALLIGHEESVTGVQWHPHPQTIYRQSHVLLSSSMDRTLLIWSAEEGVWTPLTRVGAAGGILGGPVGSSLLGYVDARFDPTGRHIVGHAYGGSLHFWTLEEAETATEDEVPQHKWRASPCLTGHFDAVTDMCWETEKGEYLLTASSDQTCRLWAPVQTVEKREIWLELSRPQVHGYDLNAIASVSTEEWPHVLVSGADEKEIRVFEAPMSTLRLLGSDVSKSCIQRVERAYIPSLGLSNKASAADALTEEQAGPNGELETSTSAKASGSQFHIPLERDLGVTALWPEVRKLFGHSTELVCLASNVAASCGLRYSDSPYSRDLLVASSCKARDVESATIRVWDVVKGISVCVLKGGHRSTVATMSFSPDGCLLASSGKDRRLCIWRRHDTENNDDGAQKPCFSLATAVDSAHKRIVWSIHFCPYEPRILASGSRDGTIKLWDCSGLPDDNEGQKTGLSPKLSFEPATKSEKKGDAVTAVAFSPRPVVGATQQKNALLGVGLESGLIELWAIDFLQESSWSCQILRQLSPGLCHIGAVTKLAWRPVLDEDKAVVDDNSKTAEFTLASSGKDHGVRIFRLKIT